ncbi:NB-ARC domain-containing protein [Promicromonospora sp. NPDC059942]|uniref:NB-ARC domain-containing protein n=1 Tax=Promicromonospora sp. NPDC059942 TaxID=3347009 RepID=UPI0036538B72
MAGSFGPLLRSLRQSARLTIEELSHASGVSVRAIGDMERGVSRGSQRRTVQALAEALELDDGRRDELADAARAGRPRTAGELPERSGWYELPRGLSDFVGRAPELELLCERGRATSADGLAPIAVVHGAAGLGKTAFAVRVAELLRDTFPDGQLYVDLRGVDPEPMAAAEALHRLLRALGLDPRTIAEDEQERAGQLRAVMAERRCLLVLDNAADEAQVRPLLPAQGAGMVIVTSRRALGGLEGVTRIPLAPFSQDESAQLLRAISEGTADSEVEETGRVSRLCGHLPLALRIAGTRLASRPGWTMGHLADRLSDEDRRLANLTAGDVGVEAAFALSYLALSSQAKEAFRRLALAPTVDFGAAVAAVLIEADLYDAEDQLDKLVELGLLQHEGADRYRFHDLIRLYASRRLQEEEPAPARAAAQGRMADWLVGTATAAGRLFEAGDGELPPHDDGLVRLTTSDEARAWLQVESDAWLAGLRLAAAAGRDQQVANLGEAMRWFAAEVQYRSDDWLEMFGLTRAAAARLPDRRKALWHMNRHVWAFLSVRSLQGEAAVKEAVERAMEVYRLADDLGATTEQADAICNAAEGWRALGAADQSLRAYSEGRELAREASYHDTYYWATNGVALALAQAGRRDEAIEIYRSLLRDIDRRSTLTIAARYSRASTLVHLSGALILEERFREAIDVVEPALGETTTQSNEVTSMLHWRLSRAYAGLGEDDEARKHLTRTLETAETYYGPWQPKYLDTARAMLAALEVRPA